MPALFVIEDGMMHKLDVSVTSLPEDTVVYRRATSFRIVDGDESDESSSVYVAVKKFAPFNVIWNTDEDYGVVEVDLINGCRSFMKPSKRIMRSMIERNDNNIQWFRKPWKVALTQLPVENTPFRTFVLGDSKTALIRVHTPSGDLSDTWWRDDFTFVE